MTVGTRKCKKVQAKKTCKIKQINFTKFFLTKFHFLQFQKWPKINFWTGKKLKTAKNAISRRKKNYLFDFTSFFTWTFFNSLTYCGLYKHKTYHNFLLGSMMPGCCIQAFFWIVQFFIIWGRWRFVRYNAFIILIKIFVRDHVKADMSWRCHHGGGDDFFGPTLALLVTMPAIFGPRHFEALSEKKRKKIC